MSAHETLYGKMSRVTISTGWRIPLATLAFSIAGCASPLNPEAGLPVPKDPGTVVVRVRDDAGQAVANALVYITQPNEIGGEFRVGGPTAANGERTFQAIPAGDRPVEVTPPAGYLVGSDGRVQTVRVVKNTTVTVTFTLARS